MESSSFNAMELDAIGEIMNISLGASATAISTMLGTKVNITTPVAQVLESGDFSFERLEPAVGVDISYVKGLEGSNVMIFRRDDVRIIVGILMGEEIPEEAFELDEMNISAICEVMNQMMGSSATALSEFLGYPVDISTPVSFEITDDVGFRAKYFPDGTSRVVVRFVLEIGDVLRSEFMNIMTLDLIKRLLAPFEESFQEADSAPLPASQPSREMEEVASQLGGEAPRAEGVMTQDQIAALLASQDGGGGAASSPAPAASQPAAPASGGMMSQAEIEALMASQMGGAASSPAPAAPQPAPAPAASSGSGSGGTMSQAEIEALMASQMGGAAPSPAPAPMPQQAAPQPAPMPQQAAPAAAPMQAVPLYQPTMDPMMLQLMNQMQQSQMQMMQMMRDMQKEKEESKSKAAERPRESTVIHPLNSPKLSDETGSGAEEQANQDMLMKLPLEISVEIGRTRKLVKDILEFTQGSLVVLDKMAGERADVFVNGECIARGDVVVVEDNFGIRITEIVSRNVNPESL